MLTGLYCGNCKDLFTEGHDAEYQIKLKKNEGYVRVELFCSEECLNEYREGVKWATHEDTKTFRITGSILNDEDKKEIEK